MNSAGKEGAAGDIRSALFEQFTDRYLPGPALDGKVDPKTAAEHARMMVGVYDNSRRIGVELLQAPEPRRTHQGRRQRGRDDQRSAGHEPGRRAAQVARSRAVRVARCGWQEPARRAGARTDGSFASASTDSRRSWCLSRRRPRHRRAGCCLRFSPDWSALLLTSLAWPVSALVRRHYGAPYRLAGQDAKAHRWVRIASTAVVAAVHRLGRHGRDDDGRLQPAVVEHRRLAVDSAAAVRGRVHRRGGRRRVERDGRRARPAQVVREDVGGGAGAGAARRCSGSRSPSI